MERRDFLKTPALGVLLPGALSFSGMSCAPEAKETKDARALPQRIHQDFETYIPGIEYFTVGNGDIIGTLQYSPEQNLQHPLTFLGLTLMDAERFARKWSTYLFHPEDGFRRSRLNVTVDGAGHVAAPENLVAVRWKVVETVPVISAQWKAGDCEVEEEYFVPSDGAVLFRRVTVSNPGAAKKKIGMNTWLCPAFALFDEIGVDQKSGTVAGHGFAAIRLLCVDRPARVAGRYDMLIDPVAVGAGGKTQALFAYAIRGDEKLLGPGKFDGMWRTTVEYWKAKPVLESGNDVLDHLYEVSRSMLKSQTARSGKRDSGVWMYNMEWGRDDVMVSLGNLAAGFTAEARILMAKVLEKWVTPEGALVESSRWVGYDYAELDQNGQVLFGLWNYYVWTGDRQFISRYWPKIRSVASFLLLDVFQHAPSGLLRNKREFWERTDNFGLEDGFELNYQFWAAWGLEHGALLAELMGDAEAARAWRAKAEAIKKGMLEKEGHLIKRRTLDGRWQKYMIPPNRQGMPPGSPIATNEKPEADPDTGTLYPIIYGYVDPKGEIAQKSLQYMERLWNQYWDTGGYARYNTDSEPDPGGGWPFSSLFVARAAAEAGDAERFWKVLRWLAEIHGGKSGAWFERYGPSITPPAPPVCWTGWTHAEVVLLVSYHLIGFRPGMDGITIRPRLLEGLDQVGLPFAIRGATVDVRVRRGQGAPEATVDGAIVPVENGAITLKYPAAGTSVIVQFTV
jgi:hypothetical protein